MNKKLILITLVTLLLACLIVIFCASAYILNNNVNMSNLNSFNQISIPTTDSTKQLTYYEQTFTNDLDPVKDVKKVDLSEAQIIVQDFYSTKWSKGEKFIIGFSSDDNHFWELSKDDKGTILILRIQNGNEYYQEENKLDKDSIDKSLVTFFSLAK